jgi:hypothetical protein
MSGCPYPELPVGDGTDDMLVVSDDFESGEAGTWLYGAEKYSDEFDTYVGGYDDAEIDTEVTKSFPVPVGANALGITFKVYELETTSTWNFVLRIHTCSLAPFTSTRPMALKRVSFVIFG